MADHAEAGRSQQWIWTALYGLDYQIPDGVASGKAPVMLAFEEVFGVPIGHSLRLVTSGPDVGAGSGLVARKHEKHDGGGKLFAVYGKVGRVRAAASWVLRSPVRGYAIHHSCHFT